MIILAFVFGFLVGGMLAAEIGRQIYNRKMTEIRAIADRIGVKV